MIEPLSRADIEEMRTVVEETDKEYIRVKRTILMRILATPYRGPLIKSFTPEPQKEIPRPPERKTGKGYGVHPNKRVVEFESQHLGWVMREVDVDASTFQKKRNVISNLSIRYARIQVSIGTVRYYAPDDETLDKLMKALGHE